MEALLGAVQRLREEGHDMELHIVGEGEDRPRLQAIYGELSWVHWHGEVYDPARVREISRGCFAGCHPGPAGLSVVHMMSLSLPVLVRTGLDQHGPEVAMIRDGNNGIRYGAGQPAASIDHALASIARDATRLRRMQAAAHNSYLALTDPSLANQLSRILLKPISRAGALEFHESAIALPPRPADHRMDTAAKQSS